MPGRGSTTERGLGAAHQQARRELPPPRGAPCPYCEKPMLPGQLLDADHPTPRALGGAGQGKLRWAHRSCNRRAGGRLGNALRGRVRPRWIDRWG